jgi:putative tricarboxylic transport membrane protein
MVVGLVLGGICERNLRRAMTLSQGSLSIFFTKPISLLFLALAAIFLLLPVIKSMIARLKETYKAPPSDDDTKKQTQE